MVAQLLLRLAVLGLLCVREVVVHDSVLNLDEGRHGGSGFLRVSRCSRFVAWVVAGFRCSCGGAVVEGGRGGRSEAKLVLIVQR